MTKYFTDEQAFLTTPIEPRDKFKVKDLLLWFKSEPWFQTNREGDGDKKYPRHFTFVCDDWNVHTITINRNLSFRFHNHTVGELKKALVVRELTAKKINEDNEEEDQPRLKNKVINQCSTAYAMLINLTGANFDNNRYRLHTYELKEVLGDFRRIAVLRSERAKKMKILNRKDLPTRLKDNFGARIMKEFKEKLTYSKPNKKVQVEYKLEFNPEGKEEHFTSSTRKEEKRRVWRRTYYSWFYTLELTVSPRWYKNMFQTGKWNFEGRMVFDYLKEYPNEFVVAKVGHQERNHTVSVRTALLDFKDKNIRWLKTPEEIAKYLYGNYQPRRRMHKIKENKETPESRKESTPDEFNQEED